MEILALVAIAIVLWLRMNTLERRIDLLEQRPHVAHEAVQPRDVPQPALAAHQPAPAMQSHEHVATRKEHRPAAAVPGPRPARASGVGISLTSENLLAIGGGLLVLLGAVFFLALAIQRGWVGETGRFVLCLAGGVALTSVGAAMRERDRSPTRRDGQLPAILVGTGTAASFLAAIVGTRIYEVVSPVTGLALAIAAGGAAVAIAVRWNAQAIAAFGIVGALAGPVLVDAPGGGATIAFTGVALAAAVGVAVLESWPWLMTLALLLTAPQVAAWITDDASAANGLAVSFAWWLLLLVGAIGHDLRTTSTSLRLSSATQVIAAAAAAAGMGALAVAFADGAEPHWRAAFLLVLAVVHVAVGAGVLAWRSALTPLAVLIAGAGATLLAVGVADRFDGPTVLVAWAVESLALAWLYRLVNDRRAAIAAAGFATVCVVHVVVLDAPPTLLTGTSAGLGGPAAALLSVIAAALAHAQLAKPAHERVRHLAVAIGSVAAFWLVWVGVLLILTADVPFDLTGITPAQQLTAAVAASVAGLAMLAAGQLRSRIELELLAVGGIASAVLWIVVGVSVGGIEIVVWLTAIAVGAALLASRIPTAPRVLAGCAALAGAALHALVVEAPPFPALSTGTADLGTATLALATVALGGIFATLRTSRVAHFGELEHVEASAEIQRTFATASTIVVVYLLSVVTVGILGDGPTGVLAANQDAQAALSILWGVLGVGGLAVGLRADVGAVRRGALALLACAVVKVVLVDTATLDTSYRVLAFVGLGILLLVGAALYRQFEHGE